MPTFTAEIIISFSDLNHNESVIPKYSKMQECTRFEMFRKKRKTKKKTKKKKEKKKERIFSAVLRLTVNPLRSFLVQL